MRLYTRAYVTRNLGWDDWVMVFGAVGILGSRGAIGRNADTGFRSWASASPSASSWPRQNSAGTCTSGT
jgi:hypothetical protein